MDMQLMTLNDIANRLNVSTSTVRRWIKSGKLIGKRVGRQWRFDPKKVVEAFERGELELDEENRENQEDITNQKIVPEWARPILTKWKIFVEEWTTKEKPDHIIVNDRRGAKVWELIMENGYKWGKNLWHSTAISFMSFSELKSIFFNRKVLLFDEMMQHGKEMYDLRTRMEKSHASVSSIVCVRRRSHVESGDLLEYKAVPCEDLDDNTFSERAMTISRLMDIFEPPLDVDHLVIRGRVSRKISPEIFIENLARWGMTFITRYPDSLYKYIVITLDRPQFFDTANIDYVKNFTISWKAPCKIRVYFDPDKGECYCSFIVYPEIKGPPELWEEMHRRLTPKKYPVGEASDIFSPDAEEIKIRRVYENISMNLAIELFKDFIVSGAANDVGICFEDILSSAETKHLKALFGREWGKEIERKIQITIKDAASQVNLFPERAQNPPMMLIRNQPAEIGALRDCYDVFRCRRDLLEEIPRKYASDGANKNIQNPISYIQLFKRLFKYSEATIGRVLDYGLDWGTIKPNSQVEFEKSKEGVDYIHVRRGFYRGEYGPWFEYNASVTTHKDAIIQKTLALGPTVLEQFLNWTKSESTTATHFNKIFTNLQHDWELNGFDDGQRPRFGMLYLGWRPYKYGPIPTIPETTSYGSYKEYKKFLKELGYIEEIPGKYGSRKRYKYRHTDNPDIPWRSIYKKRTDGFTRAHVSGLVRLYAAIQECKTTRKADPRSTNYSVFHDSLVVLSAARNEKITYICGWFEIEDWKKIGSIELFPQIEAISGYNIKPSTPFLNPLLKHFATPAKLLFDKLEMYRNITSLRLQIEELHNKGNFEIAEVLLDTIDPKPKFEHDSIYPVKNLEWACNIMRPFSSLVRRVLTNCNLDVDDRAEKVDKKGKNFDAMFYLKELLENCPELKILEKELNFCIETTQKKGELTDDAASYLSRTFTFILKMFEEQKRIPNPLPEYERRRESLQAKDGFIVRLNEIALIDPYVVCVADIKNIVNLSEISGLFNISYEDALDGLIQYVNDAAQVVSSRFSRLNFCGLCNDNLIFAGQSADEMVLFIFELFKETTKKLQTIDNRFLNFGLLRVGMAWREASKGKSFEAIKPGVIALKIGDRTGRKPGEVSITKAVWDQLSPGHKEKFIESDEDTEQGKVYKYLYILT